MAGNLFLGPIDLLSDENHVLANPRMPREQLKRLTSWVDVAASFRAHVFVLTSGTGAVSPGELKLVALPKVAILASAEASNSHLSCSSDDVWLHCLPDFHVGGIGIWARSFLARGSVSVLQPTHGWDAQQFVDAANRAGATLSSLVPAQLHDLVKLRLAAPSGIRAVLVGGGALPDATYAGARELGWPILRTYGMSETASQVATESLEDLPHRRTDSRTDSGVSYQILSHLEGSTNAEGRLCVRGASLFSGYISLDSMGRPHFWDPKDSDGWFATEDLADVKGRCLEIRGRTSDRLKIGGEIASLAALQKVLEAQMADLPGSDKVALLALPDERLESVVALVAEAAVREEVIAELVDRYNAAVMPFERIRRQFVVERIPRTELGKIRRAELLTLLPAP
jgi:O-succinylbenzoic acid--CoA ligase